VSYSVDPDSLRAGEAVPALDSGDSDRVFPRHDTLAWRWSALRLSGGLLVVGFVILLVRGRDELPGFLSDPTRFTRSGRYNG